MTVNELKDLLAKEGAKGHGECPVVLPSAELLEVKGLYPIRDGKVKVVLSSRTTSYSSKG